MVQFNILLQYIIYYYYPVGPVDCFCVDLDVKFRIIVLLEDRIIQFSPISCWRHTIILYDLLVLD